jgi:hypothetical protein
MGLKRYVFLNVSLIEVFLKLSHYYIYILSYSLPSATPTYSHFVAKSSHIYQNIYEKPDYIDDVT